MIKPVTSTKVATNGADEAAGSNPNRRIMNGSIEPDSDPRSTMPSKLKATVNATRK